jgi:hypothetical protein
MENLYNDGDMNTDLEYLYELLISPIAEYLVPMEPRDKLLIFCMTYEEYFVIMPSLGPWVWV